MHRMRGKVLIVGVSMIALVALLALMIGMRGSSDSKSALAQGEGAGATPTPTPNVSAVTCTDLYLIEQEQPVANPTPHTIGDPPPSSGGISTSMTLTYADHDTSDNEIMGVGITYNAMMPGVIAGSILDFPLPDDMRCASVAKNVADVGADETLPTIDITPKGDHGVLKGMLVYWQDADDTNDGFYVVTAADASTADLVATLATCNGVENATTDDKLYACEPNNKGIEVHGFQAVDVQSPSLVPTAEPTAKPREHSVFDFEDRFDKENNMTRATWCSVSDSVMEGAEQNRWTRYAVYTAYDDPDDSDQTPNYGISELFNPTTAKTCADIPGETKRSTLAYVTWSLDSAVIEGPDPLGVDPVGTPWDGDYDQDGCLDWRELSSPKPLYHTTGSGNWTGGRDPFNPNDCGRDLNGIWGILATAARVSLDPDTNEVLPGALYGCLADIQQTGNDLSVPVYCYIDIAAITVNPDQSAEVSCPPAPADQCGDGYTGSSYPFSSSYPPKTSGPYGQVDPTHTVLSGSYDKANDEINIVGCFNDVEGLLGPSIYIDANIDALTGHGTVIIYSAEQQVDCKGDDPQGAGTEAAIQIVQLAGVGSGDIATHDFDLDGCPDTQELSQNERDGGLRDPYNTWDYFNPTNDGENRIDDVLAVINNYRGDNPPTTNYVDRTGVGGSNNWNVGPPNGQIRIDDVLASIYQYRHDCGTWDEGPPKTGTIADKTLPPWP
jgi:hypothetical protein